jgi:nucleoside-diphosphate-sugar epimerase
MNILVTGDSGFIGTYLTKDLQHRGHSITGIDINPEKKYDVRYRYMTADILDEHALSGVPAECDCIIHLAAAHKDFGISKDEYYRVNVEGTRSLLRFATKRNIKKFFFYSTVAVYGNNQPSDESTDPSPINHYGASKLEAEKELAAWVKDDEQREVVILRPAVVFGPLNVANIFKLIKQVCDGKFFWVGTGGNIKSIAYVENVVQATSFLLDRSTAGCEVYNYSDEPHHTTKELVALIAGATGQTVPRFHIPLAAAVTAAKVFDVIGAITRYDFPITSARLLKFNTSTEHRSSKIRALGFVPAYSIKEGIQKNIQWYNDHFKHTSIKIETSSE